MFSYLGNFVGSLIMVGLVSVSGVLAGNAMPAAAAMGKVSHPLGMVSVCAGPSGHHLTSVIFSED